MTSPTPLPGRVAAPESEGARAETREQPFDYPVHLRLTGRKVLVLGAGRVATRKVERLLGTGAHLWVVAPEASASIAALAAEGRLQWLRRTAEPGDAAGALLVICATNDSAVNARMAQEARLIGGLVLRTDDPDDSDILVPARARAEHVDATISTAGRAPSASKRLGRELKAWVSAGPDRFAAEVARVRLLLHGRPGMDQRLRALAEGDLYDACAAADEKRIAMCVASALASTESCARADPRASSEWSSRAEARASTRES